MNNIITDQVLIFDNSKGKHKLISEKSSTEELNILDEQKVTETAPGLGDNLFKKVC